MCYPGSRLDVDTAVFIVDEVVDNIITTMVPDGLMEDIYGGDDRIFEFITPRLVKVCTESKDT